MKHAFLIQAHKNFDQLCRLVEYFGDERCEVFVHIDRKSRPTSGQLERLKAYPQVKLLTRRYAVHWGGFSLLKCTLHLMRKALRNSRADYFHLLSGQDYPIKSLRQMLAFFEEAEEGGHKDYLLFTHLPSPNWEHNTYERIKYFYFFDWLRRGKKANEFTQKAVAFQRKWGIRRPIPNRFDHLYGGSEWFSLRRSTCETVLRHTRRHPGFYNRLRFTFVADEVYVQTLVPNLVPHAEIRNNNYRYIRWRNEHGSSPANLADEHFYHLVRSDAFFARKFDRCSAGLMNRIDRYLLAEDRAEPTERGGWQCRTYAPHKPHCSLDNALALLCQHEEINSLLDMGCGTGMTVATLRRNGICATGYDANPHTPELSALLLTPGDEPCGVADLTDNWTEEEPFPMVTCIDTCGYIPAPFHGQVLDNLASLAGKFLILSWPTPGRVSDGQYPLYGREKEDLCQRLHERGLEYDPGITNYLRKHTAREWLRGELYAFRKMAGTCLMSAAQ